MGKRTAILLVIFFVSVGIFFYQQSFRETVKVRNEAVKLVLGASIGTRSKESDCEVRGPLPDPDCTPGDVFDGVTADEICKSGYSSSVRNVSESLKERVYQEYGIRSHGKGEYEVDHLVSLELGGSNDIANLFPEAAEPKPGFHEKDKVENYLHKMVCDGRMSLLDAQRGIANNWLVFLGEANK